MDGEKINWEKIWKKFKIPMSLGLVGLVLVSLGIFAILIIQPQESEIEILPADQVALSATFFVDLEGAVERPGLYELPAEARVNDLLVRAGGLSAEADREWVEKNLNLAQKLTDGVKLYIPRIGEKVSLSDGQVAGTSAVASGQININLASLSELDTLWGIGQSRAQDIIDQRPYQSVEDLKTKKIIPSNVYEKIKDKITVY